MATNKNKAEEVLREAYDLPHMAPVEMCENMVNALEAAGLLAPDVRILRTMEELEEFDEETVFMNIWSDLFDVSNVHAGMHREDFPYYFPCSVVATAEQVRAARKALEEDNG